MAYANNRRRTTFGRRPTNNFSYPKQRATRGRPAKDYIDPSRFIKVAREAKEIIYTPEHSFADFSLHEIIQQNLANKGIETPTPIQDKTIPHGLRGRDIVGIANTGTGKTLAFALPILQHLMADKSSRVLIMAPTRELAEQIETECRVIAKGSGLAGALLIGGSPMGRQLADLRHNPQIVIGTPGRIKDHAGRGTIQLSQFNTVVLDEVDRMLDMGFINDMRSILEMLATPRQSYFYSATMDPKVDALIKTFSYDPITISVKHGDTGDTIHQNVVHYNTSEDKLEKLHQILNDGTTLKAIVFDDTQRDVERLSKTLEAAGHKADAIHGGKTQGQRQRALRRFKASEVTILVATDVAARGIDVVDISHVINYSTPKTYDDYVHRIGRAGRAGKTGNALTFIKSQTSHTY